jgi:putative type II/III system pilus formation protein
MSFSTLRRRVHASLGFRSLAIGILLYPAVAIAEPVTDIVAVNVDQSKLVRLPGGAGVATIVVGNPLIADVTLTGGFIVVTGKGYGATNFIALDRSGAVMVDRFIQVEGPPTEQLVTIYRGSERESWSCKPICQQRVTLGDGEQYFKSAMDQASTLSSHATAAGGKGETK